MSSPTLQRGTERSEGLGSTTFRRSRWLRKVEEIASVCLRILLEEGPRALVVKVAEKIRRKEFRLLEPSPIDLRYVTMRAITAPSNAFYDYYQGMLKIAKGQEASRPRRLEEDGPPVKTSVKLIAFYLPQFHPIPENDVWWGEGFTEWTNVSKAVPQFVEHYQPRLPGELGFYDLRVGEIQEAQIKLARRYGIHGFCFYYYWFDRKRLLERPLNQFIANRKINFPFCLCWANENWTRRWDGRDQDILIRQRYSRGWDLRFIQDIESALRDDRYIRINGRPLLIVYDVSRIPSPQSVAKTWREYCRGKDIGELFLAAAQTFGFIDPRPVGFDAALGFPPHNIKIREITREMPMLNTNFRGRVYDYRQLVENELGKQPENRFRKFLTVMTGWDNDPRRPGMGQIFVHSSPVAYSKWLEDACTKTAILQNLDERLVFVNAWNEWAEGAYLEPDRRYGRAYLESTASVLNTLSHATMDEDKTYEFLDRPIEKRSKTAVMVHIYYSELTREILNHLTNLRNDFDLFVSAPTTVDLQEDEIRRQHPNVYFYRCENRGRDIAPFLRIYSYLHPLKYEVMCKIHTKRSRHRTDGELWRRDIYAKLLGTPEIVEKIITLLQTSDIGIIAPFGHLLPSEYYWGLGRCSTRNRANVLRLCERVGLDTPDLRFPFVAGSMFWFKPSALYLLTKLNLETRDFEPERGQKDGTLAHALERFLGLITKDAGFEFAQADANGDISVYANKFTISRWATPTKEGRAVVFPRQMFRHRDLRYGT